MRDTILRTVRTRRLLPTRRLGWLALTAAIVLGLAWMGEPPTWAAPGASSPNQTVPFPTPTAEPTQVPTVTPTTPPTDTPVPPTDTPAPRPTDTPGPGETPVPPTDTPTPTPTASPTEEPTATPVPKFALDLIISAPPLALQGNELVIRFIVQNPGEETVTNIVLRDLLPPQLLLVAAEAEGGQADSIQEGEGTVVQMRWDAVAPGGVLNATVTVQVAPDTPDGLVIDNLAVAYADNASADTAGISIGMPPAILPLFN